MLRGWSGSTSSRRRDVARGILAASMVERSVLILGASGFLGPHLVAAARAGGWRTIAASRAPGVAPSVDGVAPDARIEWDAEQPDALEAVLARARPDALVLAAA